MICSHQDVLEQPLSLPDADGEELPGPVGKNWTCWKLVWICLDEQKNMLDINPYGSKYLDLQEELHGARTPQLTRKRVNV